MHTDHSGLSPSFPRFPVKLHPYFIIGDVICFPSFSVSLRELSSPLLSGSLTQHPDTSKSLPTCDLILPHWGPCQPLKWFFPSIAKLTFRFLLSTADLQHVCVSSKSCLICSLGWYSGKTSAWLTSVVVGFKASCLMLNIWFWGTDKCSRSWNTIVGKRDSCLLDC